MRAKIDSSLLSEETELMHRKHWKLRTPALSSIILRLDIDSGDDIKVKFKSQALLLILGMISGIIGRWKYWRRWQKQWMTHCIDHLASNNQLIFYQKTTNLVKNDGIADNKAKFYNLLAEKKMAKQGKNGGSKLFCG